MDGGCVTAWAPTKGSHRPRRAAGLLRCHVVPAIHQGSWGTQCQSCLLWSDTGGTRAKYLPCCEASRRKPRASVPEQQWRMLFRRTCFIRECLTAGDPSLALCTLTARLGLFTLDPVQNTETPPSLPQLCLHLSSETASTCPWESATAAELEVRAWQLLCCCYVTLQCPHLLQWITPYLIWSINPRVPIKGNVWSVCKVLKGHVFYWHLLLTSSSWAKPTHARCWETPEEHVGSHRSIAPSPAATSPPEPPASYVHTNVLIPSSKWNTGLDITFVHWSCWT